MRVDEHGEEVDVDWSRGADGEGEEDEEGKDLGPKQIDHDLEREPKRTKFLHTLKRLMTKMIAATRSHPSMLQLSINQLLKI